ncbi:MAG TPA: Gfo/Idh/MocA family oxidoreductase [Candidatus Dormibacteraeota bacterium]
MNGVTGRMGANQHLARSIVAIREQGGLPTADGRRIWPDPILVGRSERKLRALAEAHGFERWSTDLGACLDDPADTVYFDALTTRLRPAAVRAAIAAGKHVYCEKPIASDLATALELARAARAAGVKNGVVQDKLWLPGLIKLRRLLESGVLGRLLSVRVEFGYWVFPGTDGQPSQRPSWNYRREDGGGIMLDMYCHWQYVLEGLFGPVRSVSAVGATHLPERVDEDGRPYRATAEDAAYGILLLDRGIVAQVNSSWVTRVRRDDLLTIHVDGTEGSAVAGLRDCRVQLRAETPVAVWNPDLPQPLDFRAGWREVDANVEFDNAFKAQWELFLRHVALDEPFPWDFLQGARGVQLAELAQRSWREGCRLDVPELTL